jgi:hypothetical protein
MTGPRTITVTGARGGSGASTVAAALALFGAREHPTELVTHDLDDMTALLGLTAPGLQTPTALTPQLNLVGEHAAGQARLVVIDAGSRLEAPQTPGRSEHYVVVRGPCYLALRRLVRAESDRYNGVILVTEPGRSLRASDVAEVLGLPIVAEVAHHPAIARSIDAGLLPARIDRLQPLHTLRALALALPRHPAHRRARTLTGTRPTTPTPTPDRAERTPQESGKDLPCPLFSGHGGRGPGRRARIGRVGARVCRPRRSVASAQHRTVASRGGRLLPR